MELNQVFFTRVHPSNAPTPQPVHSGFFDSDLYSFCSFSFAHGPLGPLSLVVSSGLRFKFYSAYLLKRVLTFKVHVKL